MTQVDFYILAATSVAQRLDFTCRLIDKALRLDKRVFVATADRRQSAELDQLLWTFRPQSFIGHSCSTDRGSDGELEPSPVLISHAGEAGDHHELLINLGAETPACFSRFERLAEVVVQLPAVLQATRDNYAFYRHRGYPIQSHDLRGKAPG